VYTTRAIVGDVREIGIRELRAHAAATVRAAAAGERVVVTVSGTPVAQLGPVEAAGAEVTFAHLVAAGAVVAPRRTDALDTGRVVATWPGLRIDRLLRELRG
jgi:prevent-host-death family protein